MNGHANGKTDVSIRSGCKPGSFLDLLVHATNKETGKPFDDMQVGFQRSRAGLKASGALTRC